MKKNKKYETKPLTFKLDISKDQRILKLLIKSKDPITYDDIRDIIDHIEETDLNTNSH